MTSGPEHYETAERLLEQAYSENCDTAYHRHLIGAATVHAVLALTAATALTPGNAPQHDADAIANGELWAEVAGVSA